MVSVSDSTKMLREQKATSRDTLGAGEFLPGATGRDLWLLQCLSAARPCRGIPLTDVPVAIEHMFSKLPWLLSVFC